MAILEFELQPVCQCCNATERCNAPELLIVPAIGINEVPYRNNWRWFSGEGQYSSHRIYYCRHHALFLLMLLLFPLLRQHYHGSTIMNTAISSSSRLSIMEEEVVLPVPSSSTPARKKKEIISIYFFRFCFLLFFSEKVKELKKLKFLKNSLILFRVRRLGRFFYTCRLPTMFHGQDPLSWKLSMQHISRDFQDLLGLLPRVTRTKDLDSFADKTAKIFFLLNHFTRGYARIKKMSDS
jgi:hypothetical protein